MYKLLPLTEKLAKTICNWQYNKPYEGYNMPSYSEAKLKGYSITNEKNRTLEYVSMYLNNQLIGFGRIKLTDEVVLGIGIDPDYCSQGHGKQLFSMLTLEAHKRYPNQVLTLFVRAFNHRAINCYKSDGFTIAEEVLKPAPSGEKVLFVKMRKNNLNEHL